MTQQLTLDAALAARDQALARVDAAADAEWVADAYAQVWWLCGRKPLWTVWRYLPKPREPRALGPILKAAVKRGWCVPEGFVTCGMTSRHAAPVRQYRSLIYGGAALTPETTAIGAAGSPAASKELGRLRGT